jgi:hypothetical protein
VDRIGEIRVMADWAPADAIAMALTHDRELAERMPAWRERLTIQYKGRRRKGS